MAELRAIDTNQFVELLAEFKGLVLGLGIAGIFTIIRIIIENLTGI